MSSSIEQYFLANPQPNTLNDNLSHTRSFLSSQSSDRPIVLVTSGGTLVPLEVNTVRFIDNFSAGTRGSSSAEYFLRHGYAAIFMARKGSLMPYTRRFKGTNWLDLLEGPEQGTIALRSGDAEDTWREYQAVKQENRLLQLDYESLNEYIWLLKSLCDILTPLQSRVCLYLAAAVSDFYIPRDRMAEHKIQSGDISSSSSSSNPTQLTLTLDAVPKFLSELVQSWLPRAYIVTFKLETDTDLLIRKSKMALEKYRHNLVVGNLLHTRAREVVAIERASGQETWLRVDGKGQEIDELIVEKVVYLHQRFRGGMT